MSISRTARLAAALLPWLLPLPVGAGVITVSPVRVLLERGVRTAAVTIRNEGGEPVTLQLEACRWSQDGLGADAYEPTSDVLLFPKIARLAPRAEQVVRIGIDGRGPPEERTYRLFVRELPVAASGEVAVRLTLNLALPLFVKPAKAKVAWSIASASLAEGRLTVRVANAGNSHLRLRKVVATGLDGAQEVFRREIAGWYVLGGSTRPFEAEIASSECLRARTVRLEASGEGGRRTFQLEITPPMCAPAPEAAPRVPSTL